MIKFFRKIRLSLIESGKTSKYFKYAIGEVVLVVIGILIALQINNWNEQRKLNEITTNYYKQILVDFDKEKKYIGRLIKLIDSSMASYNTYIKVYENPNLAHTDILEAMSKVVYISQYLKFNLNTVHTLETTGDIKLLSQAIRDKLITLKRNQETVLVMSNGNNEIYLNALFRAFELGFNNLSSKLKNSKKLKQIVEKEINVAKLIPTVHAAFGLKNFTEREFKI